MQCIFTDANGWIAPDEIKLDVAWNIVGSFHVNVFDLCNVDISQYKVAGAGVDVYCPHRACGSKFCHA